MQLYDVKINHVAEPVGFQMDEAPVVSYKVKGAQGAKQQGVRILVAANADMQAPLYDSGEIAQAAPVYPLPVQLTPRTRYFVRVAVASDAGESATADTFFETGKRGEPWHAEWITTGQADDNAVPVLGRAFTVEKPVKSARLYVGCGGIYSMQLNGARVGEEYLTPYCNNYHAWMQAITHDITAQVKRGENVLEATLAGGWYEGRFALNGLSQVYGDTVALITELHITYEDGSEEMIPTNGSWYSRRSAYQSAELYDGVVLDYARKTDERFGARVLELDKGKLVDRLSLPVVEKLTLPVQKVFQTPKGETVLDMGQNMVGVPRIDTAAFKHKDFTLRFFEVCDPEGNVYLDNLRSAKQAFVYKTDGQARVVQPEFTFYGFRYIWVDGLGADVPPEAFAGAVLYSDMEQTGSITTSSPLVDRLFLNALWGQRGNFVDVPTDCPQRDERLGWTGDAQVFCGTASYNMDTAAFFAKYLHDTWTEQQENGGGVPHFVPSFNDHSGNPNPMLGESSAAWGDVAAVMPWVNYLHTGDKALLARQYPGMRAWVEYIRGKDSGNCLWDSGFHFGDWLALDNPNEKSPLGTTPNAMVASAYYLYSTELTAKAAAALGNEADVKIYTELAGNIRAAMQREFVTPAGRIASDTQTANVIALFMGWATNPARAAADLNQKVLANGGHLNTGFVGTAYLCRVLSDFGYNDTAYKLLMNKDYPSWLYEVEKGATTIWERWNSIKPDGSLGDVGMNSYNHYAYGAVMEWMYRNAAGLQPTAQGAGFRKIRLAPQPNPRLEWVKAGYDSPQGLYRSEWKITPQGLEFEFEVPFGGEAALFLPDAPASITMNGQPAAYTEGMALGKGVYQIHYAPTNAYYQEYGPGTPMADVLARPELVEWLRGNVPGFDKLRPHTFMAPAQGSVQHWLARQGIELDAAAQSKMATDWKNVRSWD